MASTDSVETRSSRPPRSSPAAGSSRISSSGSVIRERAIWTRLRSPSLRVPNVRSASRAGARARSSSVRRPRVVEVVVLLAPAADRRCTTRRPRRRAPARSRGIRSARAALVRPIRGRSSKTSTVPRTSPRIPATPARGVDLRARRPAAAWSCRRRWDRGRPSARPPRPSSRRRRAGSPRRAGRSRRRAREPGPWLPSGASLGRWLGRGGCRRRTQTYGTGPASVRRRRRDLAGREPPARLGALRAVVLRLVAAGRVSLDEARDAVVGGDAAHDVVGLPDRDGARAADPGARPAAGRAARPGPGWRCRCPATRSASPGPPRSTPRRSRRARRWCCHGADLGLVPDRAGAGVRVAVPAGRRATPGARTSSRPTPRCGRRCLGAADALADLDVARWRPEVADELMALRRPHRPRAAPPGTDAARAGASGQLATRCRRDRRAGARRTTAARSPPREADARRGRRSPARPRCETRAGGRLLVPLASGSLRRRPSTPGRRRHRRRRPKTLLITLTGHDRPGVTRRCSPPSPRSASQVLDIEQIVLRGRLVLGVLVTAPRRLEGAARPRSRRSADDLDMQVEVDKGHGDNDEPARGPQPRHRARAPRCAPTAVSAIAGRIADIGANIDRIERMARYPVTAIDLHVSGADPDRLRTAARRGGRARSSVDVAVQPANLLRHGMRLIVMDVDSTLVQGEVIEMLAEHAGCLDEVAAVTEAAMRGELDFEAVAARAGRPARGARRVGARRRLRRPRAHPRRPHPGAHAQAARLPLRDRLRRVHPGHRPARRRPRHRLRRGQRARGGRRPAHRPHRRAVVDRAGKAAARCAASPPRPGSPRGATVAIGDGANDLDMLAAAGLGIAFNAKPVVQQAADTTRERAVPRRDHVPARDHPRGGRGRRRRGRLRHPGPAARAAWSDVSLSRRGSRTRPPRQRGRSTGTSTSKTASAAVGNPPEQLRDRRPLALAVVEDVARYADGRVVPDVHARSRRPPARPRSACEHVVDAPVVEVLVGCRLDVGAGGAGHLGATSRASGPQWRRAAWSGAPSRAPGQPGADGGRRPACLLGSAAGRGRWGVRLGLGVPHHDQLSVTRHGGHCSTP